MWINNRVAIAHVARRAGASTAQVRPPRRRTQEEEVKSMFRIALTTFCLVVSFALSSKRMRFKAMLQFVLSVFLFALVLFILPDAPFGYVIEDNLGEGTLEIVHSALLDIQKLGISVVEVINFAIIFVTLLSFFDIVEYVQRKICKKEESKKVPATQQDKTVKFLAYAENKYLLFCRLLN